jgi:KaiC/GvpD/RAD55 family RecA-like ATPase
MSGSSTLYLNIRNGLNSKPQLVPVSEYNESYIKNPNRDWYRSLFYYNESHKKILEEKETLAGIRDTIGNSLYFDFDCLENLDKARKDTITAASRLVEKGFPEESIGIYFTGKKGFNLEVSLTSEITPAQFRSAVFSIASDLQTFDRVVNDPNRVVRISGTKHQDSGLYKIPLTQDELFDLSIDEIKQKASRRRIIETNPIKANLPEELLVQEEAPIERIVKELTFDISTVDMKNRPKGIDEARWLIQNGFFRSGERNNAMLCLAATYKNLNQPEEHARALLRATAITQADRTGEDEFPDNEIDLIINQVYGPNWQGGQYTTKDPTNWLAQYAKKMKITLKEDEGLPKTISGIAPGFITYIRDMEKNTIKSGIPSLDRALHLMVGMGLAIVAPPSVGKTSLALEILEFNSRAGMTTVFVSLDMTRNRLFQKIVHRVTGMDKDEMFAAFRDGKQDDILKKVKESFGNVYFMDKSATRVDDIREFIKDVEQMTGDKVKMVMVDYFERLNTDIADANASSLRLSNELQDLTNELNILNIVLYQPNKHSYSGGPDVEITSYAAIKGSSHIIQANRAIISLSRPFFTPKTKEDDKYLVVNILKNDLGELDRLEFGWDGRRGQIYELEDAGREELKDLMEKKARGDAKDDKGNSGWD